MVFVQEIDFPKETDKKKIAVKKVICCLNDKAL